MQSYIQLLCPSLSLALCTPFFFSLSLCNSCTAVCDEIKTLNCTYLHSCSSTQFTYNDTGWWQGRGSNIHTNHHHRHQASSKNHQLCHTISILSLFFSSSFVDCSIICTAFLLLRCSIICFCRNSIFHLSSPPTSLSLSFSPASSCFRFSGALLICNEARTATFIHTPKHRYSNSSIALMYFVFRHSSVFINITDHSFKTAK